MKQDRIYIALVAGLFLLLLAGLVFQPKKISWQHTYSKSEKNPFDSRALFELLDDVFPQQKIQTLRIPSYEFVKAREKDSIPKTPANYIWLGDVASFSREDARALVQMAENGDHVFIAAQYMEGHLADTMGVSSNYQVNDFLSGKDTIRLNFKQESLYSSRGFSMRVGDNSMYVYKDSSATGIEELSVNTRGNTVFVRKQFGKGYIYYHSVPLAFTNYYMIHFNNYSYVSRCLSYMPVAPVYWDEFYKVGREKTASPMRVILQDKSLRTAYILILFLVAAYMLFQSKRRQRIIPMIKPFENSTLQFVGTVAQLYYNKGDHTSLAKKKLLYLMEKLRLKYNLPIVFNEETVKAVAARSGVDEETTRILFKNMDYVQRSYSLTESELVKFNKLVEEFWFKATLHSH